MDLSLPLDYSVIERILPHRYPFLLVDRITEFQAGQADRRYQERYAERAAPDRLRQGPACPAADDSDGSGRAGRADRGRRSPRTARS